ncbi:MAG: hypothetical protein ACLU0O_02890 [Collinsella sp.]
MADNRKRAPRGGRQAASGSRPIRRNDRAATPKGQRERSKPRLRVRSEIATATTFRSPRASLSKVAVLPPRRCALVFPSSARSLPRAGARCRLVAPGRRPQRRRCPH